MPHGNDDDGQAYTMWLVAKKKKCVKAPQQIIHSPIRREIYTGLRYRKNGPTVQQRMKMMPLVAAPAAAATQVALFVGDDDYDDDDVEWITFISHSFQFIIIHIYLIYSIASMESPCSHILLSCRE